MTGTPGVGWHSDPMQEVQDFWLGFGNPIMDPICKLPHNLFSGQSFEKSDVLEFRSMTNNYHLDTYFEGTSPDYEKRESDFSYE